MGMRYLMIAAALLGASSAYAADTNCFLIDKTGNRFQFTDAGAVWLYQPTDGADEWCAYGPDDRPDAAFSITCPEHGIDAGVVNAEGQATILDRVWKRVCRPNA